MRIWTVAVACALLGLGARPAHAADPPEQVREERVAAAALMVTYGTTFLAQMYDAHTTVKAIAAGARETNPLLAPFSSQPGVIVAVGLARATAVDLALRSIARRNKIAAVTVGAAVNYAYLIIASHNNRVASQMRAQQSSRR